MLLEAKCLSEPPPPEPEMTVEDAAKLLCLLSRTRRLDEPETDYVQLLERAEMVDYAWLAAINAGVLPADMSRAQQARRLLLAHHGLR